jgi:hypothetical protein
VLPDPFIELMVRQKLLITGVASPSALGIDISFKIGIFSPIIQKPYWGV